MANPPSSPPALPLAPSLPTSSASVVASPPTLLSPLQCSRCLALPPLNPTLLPCGWPICQLCLAALVNDGLDSQRARTGAAGRDHGAAPERISISTPNGHTQHHISYDKVFYRCPVVGCPYGIHLYRMERGDVLLRRLLEGRFNRDLPRAAPAAAELREAKAGAVDPYMGSFTPATWRSDIGAAHPGPLGSGSEPWVNHSDSLGVPGNVMASELECPVCYQLLSEPVTTPCGHTTCRSCILSAIDSSGGDCPTCRSQIPGYNHFRRRPVNRAIDHLIRVAFPSDRAERTSIISQTVPDNVIYVPIFVCSLVFPRTPCFLHIFEPRYRLMIKRALDSNRRFGMCLPNRLGGSDAFAEFGCMLEIRGVESLDGTDDEVEHGGLPRYLVNTVGVCRFRVLQRGVVDGYHVAAIERIEDVDEDDEIEMFPPPARPSRRLPSMFACDSRASAQQFVPASLATPLTASQINAYETDYKAVRTVVEAFLARIPVHERRQFEAIHGSVPEQPAAFSFWVANVLPVTEEWKYELLKLTSARKRIQSIANWIRSESRRTAGSQRGRCSVM
ncbi:hypothetical protein M427DRAFT_131039 [Gonapodya prolifera JEL478]|uniref:LON-domain-containing protein n=1 Tax=Gonapodya prolifera (strain JEL478) TaxID=1344416 RepID=A0A139AVT8_GONPJ|nr:hypothetical protein M427DRAFT_131039 [Gonapodya prolifera JEL478]|eukprot:KXS20851.1 hypothetical protein M427DRAFT_131039 [Gonapodya prolifera JEL478]